MNEKLQQEYLTAIRNFRPEFGNQKHIDAVKLIGEARAIYGKIRYGHPSEQRGKELTDELERKQKNVIFLLR